jgi:hypothetical protein
LTLKIVQASAARKSSTVRRILATAFVRKTVGLLTRKDPDDVFSTVIGGGRHGGGVHRVWRMAVLVFPFDEEMDDGGRQLAFRRYRPG